MEVTLPDFSSATVLIVGDSMLDRYWQGTAARISPEAPVPVVRVEHAEDRPGGAGNVAMNLVALGARAALLGCTGDDAAADSLETRLRGAGVACHFERLPGAVTITKLRVLSRHQQLIRLDFEQPFSGLDATALLARFRSLVGQAGAVILSDYGKGTLGNSEALIAAAREARRPVIVDPKRLDFSGYAGASVVTPNLAELEAVVGPCPDERALTERAQTLMAAHNLGALLVTRGEHGMTLLRPGEPELHLPAQAREVYDVTGAGDTVVATLGAALAAGQSLPSAVALANLAAGIVVAKLGTATVSVAELALALGGRRQQGQGVMTEAQLAVAVEAACAQGERIVMTNGCFDILHAGHVWYLEQARRLGDRLIVAVNDDASVERLKGPGRPVNPVDRRMAVLAALSAVDWVVPFAEETPERLICALRPHLLVKGGDYRPDQVAGRQCVEMAGGRVAILPYREGYSTSAIIDNIRAAEGEAGNSLL
jgi:D-beta-D-heptose 7-phosphate kinase/D-beta-D-heptose 1-phosphate adenosyltransferase